MANNLSKSKYWRILAYPEHYSREEVINILSDEFCVDFMISPKHSPDGDLKEHYHILVTYCNRVSSKNPDLISNRLKSPMPLPCSDPIRACRYMIHLDDPQKEQGFKREDISVFGVHSQLIYAKSFSDNELYKSMAIFRVIQNYIVDNKITDIFMVQQYFLLNGDYQSYQLLNSNYTYFKQLCQSGLGIHLDDEIYND